MRINNKRINTYVEAVYILLILGLFCSILLLFIPIPPIIKIAPAYIYILVFILAIMGFKNLGPHHVEYSSDGEVLNIKTQDPFFAKYFRQQKSLVDFPKSKLVDYKISGNILHRKLELYLKSKRTNNGIKKLSFNITFLSKNERQDLHRSLKKIIRNNTKDNNNPEEEVG